MKAREGTVLITGAAGFLGSALLRALRRGPGSQPAASRLVSTQVPGVTQNADRKIHALVRPTTDPWRITPLKDAITLHTVDFTDRPTLAQAIAAIRPEIIYHLAVEGVARAQRNQWAIASNVAAAANLLEATEPLEYRRLIHVGGASEYGCKPGPIQEDDLPQPMTLYGATKAAATLLMQYAARAAAKPITILRPFSVYGPREPAGRLIPTAVLAALRGTEIRLTASGIRRDFVYVDDVAEACILAADAEAAAGQTINIGTAREFANEEVVSLILAVAGRSVPVHPGALEARPWDCAHCLARIDRARQLLNWTPRHSLEEGLRKTVAWFQEHGSRYP
jgi:nucleoside-diphosphate-sugar epimerase